MALALTKDERTLLISALDRDIDSAKRQQNMKGKTTTMKEVFAAHERLLQTLKGKIAEDK